MKLFVDSTEVPIKYFEFSLIGMLNKDVHQEV